MKTGVIYATNRALKNGFSMDDVSVLDMRVTKT